MSQITAESPSALPIDGETAAEHCRNALQALDLIPLAETPEAAALLIATARTRIVMARREIDRGNIGTGRIA